MGISWLCRRPSTSTSWQVAPMVHCAGWRGRGARLGGRSSSVGTGWNSVVRDMSPSESPGICEVVAYAASGATGLRVRRGAGVRLGEVALRDIVDSSVKRESATPRPIEVADGTGWSTGPRTGGAEAPRVPPAMNWRARAPHNARQQKSAEHRTMGAGAPR